MDDARRLWDELSPEQRRSVTMSASVFLLFTFLGSRVLLVGAVVAFLSTQKPSNTSFHVFFERWFKGEYFPQLNERYIREYEERSRSSDAHGSSTRRGSVMDHIKETASTWLLGRTRDLQANLIWESIRRNPIGWMDWGFMRTATVNLGTPDDEHLIVFWGIGTIGWFLAPYYKLDFDNVSLLVPPSATGSSSSSSSSR